MFTTWLVKAFSLTLEIYFSSWFLCETYNIDLNARYGLNKQGFPLCSLTDVNLWVRAYLIFFIVYPSKFL